MVKLLSFISSFIRTEISGAFPSTGLNIQQLCALISGVIHSSRLLPRQNQELLPRQDQELLPYQILTESCGKLLSTKNNIGDLLENLLSPILWAAPKKRTSHSRKRLRMTNKWLKPIYHYTFCTKCGNPKLPHVLCGTCFKEIMKKTAEYRRNVDMTK